MKSFDDAVSRHKNNLIESLSQFNEGHRVRELLMDIESNKSDYEYYFNAGQQSKQAEVDELKREMLNKTNEAYVDGQKSMRKMIKSNEDELQNRIDTTLNHTINYGGYDDLTHIINILKGDSHEP